MPKGKCVKCGSVYHGWSLIYKKEDNICFKCGGMIQVDPEPVNQDTSKRVRGPGR